MITRNARATAGMLAAIIVGAVGFTVGAMGAESAPEAPRTVTIAPVAVPEASPAPVAPCGAAGGKILTESACADRAAESDTPVRRGAPCVDLAGDSGRYAPASGGGFVCDVPEAPRSADSAVRVESTSETAPAPRTAPVREDAAMPAPATPEAPTAPVVIAPEAPAAPTPATYAHDENGQEVPLPGAGK